MLTHRFQRSIVLLLLAVAACGGPDCPPGTAAGTGGVCVAAPTTDSGVDSGVVDGGACDCNGATPVCANGVCVECAADTDCAAGVCDVTANECVGCLGDTDCSAGVCDTTTNECVGCLSDVDCADGVCDVTANACVGCLGDADCADGVCDTTASECVGCLRQIDCADGVCDVDSRQCVQCLQDSNCTTPEAPLCDLATNLCEGCRVSSDCAPFPGRPQCEPTSGVCHECLPATQDSDCGAFSCDPLAFECGPFTRGSRPTLRSCVSDDDCVAADARCVAVALIEGPETICIVGSTSPGNMNTLAISTESTSGTPFSRHVLAPVTTAEGFYDLALEARTGGTIFCAGEGDPTLCEPGMLCERLYSGAYTGQLSCTIPCSTNADCPSGDDPGEQWNCGTNAMGVRYCGQN